MIIPNKAVKYILYQRTKYQKLSRSKSFRWLVRFLPFVNVVKAGVFLDSIFYRQQIKNFYEQQMKSEYETIQTALPKECSAILDIGCGIGGINVFLFDYYNRNPKLKFHMLDKSQVDSNIFYGFEKEAAFYNSLAMTKKFLSLNGIPYENIDLQDVSETKDFPKNLDLVISLRSWGFHYPVNTYLKKTYRALNTDGRLILDIRTGSSGQSELEELFDSVQIIDTEDSGPTFRRFLAVK